MSVCFLPFKKFLNIHNKKSDSIKNRLLKTGFEFQVTQWPWFRKDACSVSTGCHPCPQTWLGVADVRKSHHQGHRYSFHSSKEHFYTWQSGKPKAIFRILHQLPVGGGEETFTLIVFLRVTYYCRIFYTPTNRNKSNQRWISFFFSFLILSVLGYVCMMCRFVTYAYKCHVGRGGFLYPIAILPFK